MLQICITLQQGTNYLHQGEASLDEVKTAVRPVKPAIAVIGFTKWNLYFYFDICITQPF